MTGGLMAAGDAAPSHNGEVTGVGAGACYGGSRVAGLARNKEEHSANSVVGLWPQDWVIEGRTAEERLWAGWGNSGEGSRPRRGGLRRAMTCGPTWSELSPPPPQRPRPISPPPRGIGGQPHSNHPTSPGHITLASQTLFAFRFCAKPNRQGVSWGEREKQGGESKESRGLISVAVGCPGASRGSTPGGCEVVRSTSRWNQRAEQP
jgi:hypothetical protein